MAPISNRILIIGLVWPEPTSSAAGTRMMQLIKFYKLEGYEIFFASAANKSSFSENLEKINITEINIELNSNTFNEVLLNINPNIVLFDRYITEEQYGWRVREQLENTITILDTEDLHFLRISRAQSIKKNSEINLYNDVTRREIASILRCDLSLIISEEEMNLLKDEFRIDEDLLLYLPFLEEIPDHNHTSNWKTFEDRANFMFIGNFLHEPNWHTTLVLKNEIWPKLSKLLPMAEMHIYGAYPSEKVYQLNNTKERFIIKGRAENAIETMGNYKLLLAPIKFGAGAKGKLIDSMQSGTPNITTVIGAEGMNIDHIWNGAIAQNMEEFIDEAYTFYTQSTNWYNAQQKGLELLNLKYDKFKFYPKLTEKHLYLLNNLKNHRIKNFIGSILNYNNINSFKYLSLWIQEKNKF